VYGFTKAETDGWASTTTMVFLAIAVALIVAFVLIESRIDYPLLPLRVLTERNRGAAYLGGLLMGAGMFGTFVLLTYYLQATLHYSALRTGFAFLPFSLGVITGATLSSQLLTRIGPRHILTAGMVLGAIGLVLFSRVGVHTGFWSHVFPPELITSIGLGSAFVPLTNTALVGVDKADSGVASALVNTAQQVGGSLGTALLNTIAASATAGYLASHTSTVAFEAHGMVHGYTVAFTVAAAILALSAVASAILVQPHRYHLDLEADALIA
jgi:predicted MFS family arabinose efflux permease